MELGDRDDFSMGGSAAQDVAMEEPVALENTWSFWHDKFIGPGQTVEEYEASLHKLCTFSTIQVSQIRSRRPTIFAFRIFNQSD